MPAPPEPVLIVALSGRALAQAARAAGFAPVVLDAFGDLDTREAAQAWARVPVDRRRWRFRRGPLLAAAARLAPPPIPLAWGSGFEAAAGLLAALARGRPLWGTAPAAVAAAKDPLAFAATAARLGVPHPETRATPPADPTGWLLKRRGAAGGGHVRRAAADAATPSGRGWYWQRLAPGRPVSALVVADGGAARVLGFSEQWTDAAADRRFRFKGVAVPARLSPAAERRLGEAAAALAVACGLRGLASVDALVAGAERVTVLEVNPRAGASLDAHAGAARDGAAGLFRLHRDACVGAAGRPPGAPPAPAGAAGAAIVRAPAALRIPERFAWPEWTADRTPPGTRVAAGAPLCTVLARAAGTAAVRRALAARERRLLATLGAVRRGAPRRSSGARSSSDAARATAPPGTGP